MSLHGHGAKGGAYARLGGDAAAIRVYTPHGGSLHYRRARRVGLLYLTLERVLMRRTDLFLFESAYGRDAFRAKIGDAARRWCASCTTASTASRIRPVAAARRRDRSRVRRRVAHAQRRRRADRGASRCSRATAAR